MTNAALNSLFGAAWPDHADTDFEAQLTHSLTHLCAYADDQLIGFVNVAWDGGIHAFLLDTTIHPDFRRRGIGQALVRQAATVAKAKGIHWLHVDYEPHLDTFYGACGFQTTSAGLMRLTKL